MKYKFRAKLIYYVPSVEDFTIERVKSIEAHNDEDAKEKASEIIKEMIKKESISYKGEKYDVGEVRYEVGKMIAEGKHFPGQQLELLKDLK